jgi:hypothetical protein
MHRVRKTPDLRKNFMWRVCSPFFLTLRFLLMAVAMLANLRKSPSQRTKSELVGALHSLANCSEIVSSSEQGIVLYPALLHGTGCSKGIDDCGCCGAGRMGVPVKLREGAQHSRQQRTTPRRTCVLFVLKASSLFHTRALESQSHISMEGELCMSDL